MRTARLSTKSRSSILNELKRRNTPTQDLVTCSEVQKVIAVETEKATSHCTTPVLTGLVKNKSNEALQGAYDPTKEGVETSLYNLVGEFITKIIQP